MKVGFHDMIILLAGMGISITHIMKRRRRVEPDRFSNFQDHNNSNAAPTIFFVMITGIISGFQVFDVIFMMIETNPAYESTESSCYVVLPNRIRLWL